MTGLPELELTVEEYLSGNRVDTFLGKHLRNYSPWRIQRIVQNGGATIDGRVVDVIERLYAGQRVRVRLLEPPDKLIAPHDADLEILFEDPWIMVINKPAGVICHPVGDYQSDTLCHHIQAHLDRQSLGPGVMRPGIVHRLDRQTSGAIVVTKDHLSHRMLSIEFQNERVSKAYLALAQGTIPGDEKMIDYPIGQSRGDTILMSAKAGAIDAKPSRTRIRVLQRFSQHTFVEAKPFTGRNHQIRVHLAEIGHPIVGDEYYLPFGKLKPKRPDYPAEFPWLEEVPNTVDPETGLTRHFLHAYRLEFSHPITEEWMTFHAPLTPDLSAALHRLSKQASVTS
ncbi:MAG: RluA family pseudouridine synthase [Planctomycetaceae bacterium]|nr:RluA family pseudouridine synthase [Planctomycetaceae bacterium]